MTEVRDYMIARSVQDLEAIRMELHADRMILIGHSDPRTIQILMGHERLEDTTVYLQLSRRHLHVALNSLEQIALPAEEGRKR